MYLGSLLRQVEGDALADFGRQLSEHFRFETADHDLAQLLVQLVQVGRPATVPLPARPKVPEREVNDVFVFFIHISNREKLIHGNALEE